MNIDEKNKKLLILVFAALLILLFDFLLLMKPQFNALNRINPKLRNLHRAVRLAKSDIKQKSNFEKRHESAKEKISYSDRLIPKDEQIYLILDEISLIAKESLVKISQLTPLTENKELALETSGGTYYRLPVFIEAFCGYHQFGVFLNKIEYSQIFMKTAEIEMMQNKNDLRNHQLRLIIDAFVAKK